ncbi:MAG: GNAT family N-acetyltransferase, partial [Candidatus Heimdallarchaeota archaeon]|nr:GNAT family N-acetyltransferase [Candidatus Heimdallarchaeota archaeon]
LPDNFSDEVKQGLLERMKKSNKDSSSDVKYYGVFDSNLLLGGMIYFDYTMTVFSQKNHLPVGGVGLICVDLLHKKQHVAKSIMKAFHEHYYNRGISITILYPFRPDFYAAFGYGLGKKMNQYRFRPIDLPKTIKKHLIPLNPSHKTLVTECFNRYASNTHGMIQKNEAEFERLLSCPNVIGYEKNGVIQGFLSFKFKKVDPDHSILQDLIIKELIYENAEALSELLTYLHSQADQVRNMFFHTQDDYFHYLLHDPRNGKKIFLTSQESNIQGLGIMYRIINAQKLFTDLETHNFGNQSISLKLTLKDSFLPSNNGSLIIKFDHGQSQIQDESDSVDAVITLDIKYFSSVFMGVVSF